MSTATEFTCHHCNAKVTPAEMTDGWCETCGKKLPFSFKAEAKRMTAPPIASHDAYDEPAPGSGRRLLISGLVLISLLAVGAFAVLQLG